MDVMTSGLGLVEGPVTCQDGSLIVTSIDQGRVYRIIGQQAQILAVTGGGPNGATEGRDGLIYVAQNGGAPSPVKSVRDPANVVPSLPGIQVIDSGGNIELFGTVMRSPSDLCFGPDGLLYVTDPTRKPERDEGRIWCCDVRSGLCTLLMECDWYPNGIGFSLEDDYVYVADSRHRRIVRFPLASPGPQSVETIVQLGHGIPDGFAFDVGGNLVVACPQYPPGVGDIRVYRANQLVEIVHPGRSWLYTNLAISADQKIYVCDAELGQLLVAPWPVAGLPLHPFR